MGRMEADLPSLERLAERSADRQSELEHLRVAMDGGQLPRDAFGYVPGIGSRVYEAYHEFMHSCALSIGSAARTMGDVAEAVRDTVEAYRTNDDSSRAALSAIDFGMAGTDLREVR
jgi:hypothetical protein